MAQGSLRIVKTDTYIGPENEAPEGVYYGQLRACSGPVLFAITAGGRIVTLTMDGKHHISSFMSAADHITADKVKSINISITV
jgi:hypothetical protein